MRIVPRSEWAGDIRPNGTPRRIGTPTPRLWLHHGAAGSSSLATARSYLRYHINTLGWLDGGYSFIIADGRVLEVRGAGRSGAHTNGDNNSSHGICIAGNYTSRAISEDDLDALVWLIKHGAVRDWWRNPYLTGGHRDSPGGKATGTTCPGARLQRQIPSINALSREEKEEILAILSDAEQRETQELLKDVRALKERGIDVSDLRYVVERTHRPLVTAQSRGEFELQDLNYPVETHRYVRDELVPMVENLDKTLTEVKRSLPEYFPPE